MIPLRRLEEERLRNMEGRDLVEVIQSDAETWPGHLSRLLKHKYDLTVVQGVAMYKEQPIVPPSLRVEVLETLNSGHQGVTSMVARPAGPPTLSGSQC